MAIARDSSLANYKGTSSTSSTFSFTNTAGDTMYVGTYAGSSTDIVTGVTYNGVSLTKIASKQLGTSQWIGIWYLKSPATGANNIVISASSSADIEGQVITYTGGNTTTQPDSFNSSSTSGNITTSTTVVDTGCWLVSNARSASTGPMNASTGVGFTVTGASAFRMGDSNGTVSTGSQSQTYTGSGNSAMVIASIKPAGGGGGGATAYPAILLNYLTI